MLWKQYDNETFLFLYRGNLRCRDWFVRRILIYLNTYKYIYILTNVRRHF